MWLFSGWVLIASFLSLEVSSQRREIPPPGNEDIQSPIVPLSSDWRDWDDSEFDYAMSLVQNQHNMDSSGPEIPPPGNEDIQSPIVPLSSDWRDWEDDEFDYAMSLVQNQHNIDSSMFKDLQNQVFRRRFKKQPKVLSSDWRNWRNDEWNEAMLQVKLQHQMQDRPVPTPPIMQYSDFRDEAIQYPGFAIPQNQYYRRYENQANGLSSDWRDWKDDDWNEAVSQVMIQHHINPNQMMPNGLSYKPNRDVITYPQIFTAPQNQDFPINDNGAGIFSSNARDFGNEYFNKVRLQVWKQHLARPRQMNIPDIFTASLQRQNYQRNNLPTIKSSNWRNWIKGEWNQALSTKQLQMPIPQQGGMNGFDAISPYNIPYEDGSTYFPSYSGQYMFNPSGEYFRNIWNRIIRKKVAESQAPPNIFQPYVPTIPAVVDPVDSSLSKKSDAMIHPFDEFHNLPEEITAMPKDFIINPPIEEIEVGLPGPIEPTPNEPVKTTTQVSVEASDSTVNVSDVDTSTGTIEHKNTQPTTHAHVIVTTTSVDTSPETPITSTQSTTTTEIPTIASTITEIPTTTITVHPITIISEVPITATTTELPTTTSTQPTIITTTTQLTTTTTEPTTTITTTEPTTTQFTIITTNSQSTTTTTTEPTTITTVQPTITTTTQPTTTTTTESTTTTTTTEPTTTTTTQPTVITTTQPINITSTEPADTTTTTIPERTTQPRQPGKRHERLSK